MQKLRKEGNYTFLHDKQYKEVYVDGTGLRKDMVMT